LTNPL